MSDKKKGTITHAVEDANGEELFSTQLPTDVPPEVYTRICRNMDENARTEATAGRAGAIDSLQLAVLLDPTCVRGNQVYQDNAYKDAIATTYGRHGKSKAAYANHRKEIRMSQESLRQALMPIKECLEERGYVFSLIVKSWLREEEEKEVKEKEVSFTATEEEGEEDDEGADDSTASLTGVLAAAESRCKGIKRNDLQPNPAEVLNKIRALEQALATAKSYTISVLRQP